MVAEEEEDGFPADQESFEPGEEGRGTDVPDIAKEGEVGGCGWDVEVGGGVGFEVEVGEDLEVDHVSIKGLLDDGRFGDDLNGFDLDA